MEEYQARQRENSKREFNETKMQLREAASTIIDRNESLSRCGWSTEVTNKGANESLTNRSNVREELRKSCDIRKVVGETLRPFVLVRVIVNKTRFIRVCVYVCTCIYIFTTTSFAIIFFSRLIHVTMPVNMCK